jgi:hypothetical protein
MAEPMASAICSKMLPHAFLLLDELVGDLAEDIRPGGEAGETECRDWIGQPHQGRRLPGEIAGSLDEIEGAACDVSDRIRDITK